MALVAAAAWAVWGLRLLTGRRWLDGWELPVALATAAALVALWLVRLGFGMLPP